MRLYPNPSILGAIGSGTQLQTKTPQITLITQIQKAWRIKRLRRVVPAARFFEQAAPILDPEFFIKSVKSVESVAAFAFNRDPWSGGLIVFPVFG